MHYIIFHADAQWKNVGYSANYRIADIIGNNAILLQSAASPWHYIHFTQRALYIFAPRMTKDGVN